MELRSLRPGICAGAAILAAGIIVGATWAASAGTSDREEQVREDAAVANSLTDDEKKEGWELLFDGKSLDGWRGYRMQTIPAGWSVDDGAIHFVPPTAGRRADIISKKQYQDFELVVEWAVTPGGNSGIFFRVSEDAERTYYTGPEFQVLDNAGHRDGLRAETSAGSNYALHAPLKDVTRPIGEWNEARIRVEGAHVVHWLNGTKILEYELWTPEWNALVVVSKFVVMPGYGMNKSGHIALQDHGHDVRFQNIKIRPL
jgi:hypothetical protein